MAEATNADQTHHNQSLDSLLPSLQLRIEFAGLVADITDRISADLTSIFEPVESQNTSPLGQSPAHQEPTSGWQHGDEQQVHQVQHLRSNLSRFYANWKSSVLTRIEQVLGCKCAPRQKSEGSLHTNPQRSSHAHHGSNSVHLPHYSPIPNTITSHLDDQQRSLVLHSVVLLMLSLEHYSAFSRVLLLNITVSLGLPPNHLSDHETTVARTLLDAAELTADAETKRKAQENTQSRRWRVGLATVAGAALVGVTGGLAAPLVAAGLGSVMGGLGLGATAAAGYLGTLASSSLVIGGLFGAYGGRMTGRIMDQYAKQVDDFAFIPLHTAPSPKTRASDLDHRRLRVAIAISGWLTDERDVVDPWYILASSIEGFALRWEMQSLLRLGNAITDLLSSTAWAYAKRELITRSIFKVLLSALWPLQILKAAHIVDNPFSVGLARADKAGKVLADAIANRAQGERPVTLIGYSLGARVIYTCLRELANRGQFGLIEDAVLLGGPLPSTALDWLHMRAVVAGRLINVYSSNDYVLAFLYRSSALSYGVSGLQAIHNVAGVESIDVSDIILGHIKYRFLTGPILRRVGFQDLNLDNTASEEAKMVCLDQNHDEPPERPSST